MEPRFNCRRSGSGKERSRTSPRYPSRARSGEPRLHQERHADAGGRVADAHGDGNPIRDPEAGPEVERWSGGEAVVAEEVEVDARLAERGKPIGEPEVPLHDRREK